MNAYKQGFLDGIRAYAWHKDGAQQVGTTGKTLKEAQANVEKTWNYAPPFVEPTTDNVGATDRWQDPRDLSGGETDCASSMTTAEAEAIRDSRPGEIVSVLSLPAQDKPDTPYKLIEEAWQIFTGNNCKFSAGWVEPPQGPRGVDTVYLRFERDGVEPMHFLLRPDELSAIAACASHVVARDHVNRADRS